jgi:phage terminase Nu1 subunit (DNA packaging protein)
MPKPRKKTNDNQRLKGWSEIAEYLELPPTTAQRWAKQGMPVRREGRYVQASTDELRRWLGTAQVGDPVDSIVGNKSDLAAELKRSLKPLRKRAA